MRRSRSFTPDMFPFLAVLLCAMGSLIFILLVLDQQARKLAHQRAMKQQEQAREQLSTEEAQRLAKIAKVRAEQQRKLKLVISSHQQTAQQRAAAEKNQSQAKLNLQQLLKGMEEEQRQINLTKKEQARIQALIERQKQRLSSKKESIGKLSQLISKMTEARQDLQSDLELLTAKLSQAKKARSKETKQRSIVPYAGTRGANRAPLYVESSRNGLIFYPDRKKIPLGEDHVLALRQEVQERTRRFTEAAGEKVYWLLLVRPDGILGYYQFQAAIRGAPVPYGYELIDQEWELDLPLAKKLPPPSTKPMKATGGGTGQGGGLLGKPVKPGGASKGIQGAKPQGGGGLRKLAPIVTHGSSKAGATLVHPSQPNEKAVAGSGQGRGGSANEGNKPRNLAPAARLGDRDWELIVECTPREARLHPSGLVLPISSLVPGTAEARKFFETAWNLVEMQKTRLKARKINGKPNIRFVVERDALRTYHLAYPLLTRIQAPKTAVMKEE